MPTRASVPPSPSILTPKSQRLKPTQEAFLSHYLNPSDPKSFGNGTEAYARSHPGCKSRGAAEVGAVRTLGSDRVRESIDAMGWGRERLEAEMRWNIDTCKKVKKMSDHREGVKVLAQLTGEWKEKQEIAHVESGEKELVRGLVAQALKAPSTPTVGVQN